MCCAQQFFCSGQTRPSEYQPGTITAIAPHPSSRQQENNVPQYDLSVKVGHTTYLVLYTPANQSDVVKRWVGSDLRVLVRSNTLTLNSAVLGETEVPILGRETLPAQGLDWSQVCGQYFSNKLPRLSEILALTQGQQAEVRRSWNRRLRKSQKFVGSGVFARGQSQPVQETCARIGRKDKTGVSQQASCRNFRICAKSKNKTWKKSSQSRSSMQASD